MNATRRWAVGVVALAMAVAACGDDPVAAPSTDDPNATTTTEATITPTSTITTTSTTGSTTTTGPTTTSTEPASTTTEAREVPYWTAECTELLGEARQYDPDPRMQELTTLGMAPALQLRLPEVETSAGPLVPRAGWASIPGGVLTEVVPPDYWPGPEGPIDSGAVVAVDHDGSVRWRRCLDGIDQRALHVAPTVLAPTTAWVLSSVTDDPLTIWGFDLATGADVPFPLDVSGRAPRGVGDRFIVLGERYDDAESIASDDRLLVVDLLDATVTEVPYPPSLVGRPSDDAWFTVHDVDPLDDDVVLVLGSLWPGDTRSVFVDGSWTDDPAIWSDVLPGAVVETYEPPYELRLLDGAGNEVWSVPEFHGHPGEGFHSAIAGQVVLAIRCVSWSQEAGCAAPAAGPPTEELVGFDVAAGQELWTLPGFRSVPVIAGDVAIVYEPGDVSDSTDDGYVLIDLSSGRRLGPDGDPWPSDAFTEECCGGGEYVYVDRSGGVVAAIDGEVVSVWYPPELTAETVTVDLMG